MLDSKKHLYDLLIGNSALTAALGSSTKIQYAYPNDFNSLPIVTYLEINNQHRDFFDNAPFSEESVIQIDVWTNVSTTAISKLVDAALVADFYTRDYAADVPDPSDKVFHKVLKYRRTFNSDELDSL